MEDDVLQLFLEDTREHLADIETDLLDIEEAGADYDPELVNKVFRTAHSIKGSAGFLALDNIRDLSHKIENVLDMVRNNELTPDSAVVNVILNAFDQLEAMVENIQESEDMDISAHVEALTGLVQASLPQEEQESVTTSHGLGLPDGREVFSITEYELKQARKGGNFIYLAEYDLIHDVHKKNMNPLELLKFLEKSGRILECRMDVSSVGSLEDEPTNRIPFFVLYASLLEPDFVAAVLGLGQNFIHTIDTDDMVAGGGDKSAANEPLPLLEEEPAPQQQAPKAEPAAAPASAGEEFSEIIEEHALSGTAQSVTLTLSGDLTVDRAAGVKQALLAALSKSSAVQVELSQAQAADVSLLQLLVAAKRSGQSKGVAFIVAGKPAEPVLQAYHRAGFDVFTGEDSLFAQ